MGENIFQKSRSDSGIGAPNACNHLHGRHPNRPDRNDRRKNRVRPRRMRAVLGVQTDPIFGNATADIGAKMDRNRIDRCVPMSGKFQRLL
jgi:hypothetical protein